MMSARLEPSHSELTILELEHALKIESLRDYGSAHDWTDLRQDAIVAAVEKFDDIWLGGWDDALEAGDVSTENPIMFSPTLDTKRWNRAELYRMARVWLGSGCTDLRSRSGGVSPSRARGLPQDL
jgi:hypothetical protein